MEFKDFLLNDTEYTYDEKCSMAIKYMARLYDDCECTLDCISDDIKNDFENNYASKRLIKCKSICEYNNCETRFVYEWLMENLKK